MVEGKMALNLPLKGSCPKQRVIQVWKVRCRTAQELHGRNYQNKLQSPHLCLAFISDEIQQVLRLYGYVNTDNWYFHKQAHQEVSIWYLEEDQTLKSQTSMSSRPQLLPGCSLYSNEEILLPQQKPENSNQHRSDTVPNLHSSPRQELKKPGRVFPAT